MTDFNFKEWADLYQVDPEAFERRREAVLEGYVASVDPAHRQSLEQTLFRIRMIRQRSKSPLQSALESSKLMWESFGKLREQVELLERQASPAPLARNGLRLINPDCTPESQPGSEMKEMPGREMNSRKPISPGARVIQFKGSGRSAH